MTATIADRLRAALGKHYVLERELGAGGMATVWLARDVRHDRAVALKVLRPELTAVLGAERFLAEIRLTARLDHPHILTLIDSGEADGLLYYVLPFVRGESLRARLDREKQLPVDEAVRLMRQAAAALAYAHANGVIHRDIKPENILLHEGEAVMTDFGIALALREAGGTRLTESGLSLGTPQYMSPEQATGDRDLDARSDVYGLGAVLYELLAGDPPHTGATVHAVIAKLLTERPTPLRTLRPTVPAALETAVFTALAKLPADRFPGAASFGEAIGAALKQPAPAPTTSRAPRARWPALAALAALTLGLGLGAAAGAWLARRGETDRATMTPRTGLAATFSGDVVDFALAPDGQRLALGRLACPTSARCGSLLEVRGVQGGISLPLARFRATYDMRWSRDGRFVHVTGVDSAGRLGLFRISALGGPVSYLGAFVSAETVGQTDSLLVGVPGPSHVRLGVLMPGESAMRDTATFPHLSDWALSPDASRLLLVERHRDQPQLRIVDRRWRTLDSITVADYYSHPRWSSAGDALVWIANGEEGLYVSRVGVDMSAGKFRGTSAAVTVPFDMPQSFAGRRLDVADDGTIAYVSGLTPRVLHLLARPRGGVLPTSIRQVETQVGRMRAYMAPDGGAMAFSRLVPNGDATADQLVHLDLATGAEREVSPPLGNFVDAAWTPDGRALIYARYEAGIGTRLTRWNRATGRRSDEGTHSGRLERIWILADESVLAVGADRASVERLTAGSASRVRTFPLPGGQGLAALAPSPDGSRAATLTWRDLSDSISIGQLDMRSGAWTEFGRIAAEGTGTMRWFADGQVEFTLTSTVATTELYRLDPRSGAVRRLGELPVPFAAYDFSADGLSAAAVERRVFSDVVLVRPRQSQPGSRRR